MQYIVWPQEDTHVQATEFKYDTKSAKGLGMCADYKL